MLQLPELYSRHLEKQFNYSQYLIVLILLNLLQNLKTVRLEELARRFPSPIKLKSRVMKLQRFLSLKQFNLKTLWFPIVKSWIEENFNKREVIALALDRSQWQGINLLMVSLMYDKRGIPLYFCLLPKKGNSNLAYKKKVLEPVFKLLKGFKIVVLGDREFCNVELGEWLSEQEKVYFSLRLKKNEYVELEDSIWFQLQELGLSPGTALFYEGIRVTKTKGFGGFNLAAKYGRNYRQKSCKEPWYILTNLGTLSAAIAAYSKRMGIEEMFRDFKKGGYNLELTQVTGERLIALILLISLAYCLSIFNGKAIKNKGVSNYVARPNEPGRTYRRHSNFSVGLHGQNWVDSMAFFQDVVQELLRFSTGKNDYYRQGMRAASVIQSAL
jgi:hypothetical protein